MKQEVNILVTIHKPEMVNAAFLVFKTIKIGFPTAKIKIYGNNLQAIYLHEFHRMGYYPHNIEQTCHDEWIEKLVSKEQNPFWICDTDVVFFDKVEDWFSDRVIFAGRHIPSYKEPWTKTISVERLHTALMYFNPARIRNEMSRWSKQTIPSIFHSTQVPFIRQNFIPHNGEIYLYDTCAGLYQIGIGTPFTSEQNAAFEHLHAGTYSDKVSEDCPELKDLYNTHKVIYQNPQLALGLKQIQDKFYQQHKI